MEDYQSIVTIADHSSTIRSLDLLKYETKVCLQSLRFDCMKRILYITQIFIKNMKTSLVISSHTIVIKDIIWV